MEWLKFKSVCVRNNDNVKCYFIFGFLLLCDIDFYIGFC